MELTENQVDKIKGVVFGQAIGDALGLATEFMSKSEVKKAYPNGVKSYSDIQQDEHTSRWEKGDWTDDTDQMLCILDAILKDQMLTRERVCENFMDWFHNEPMGIGNTVFSVLSDPHFKSDPIAVSKRVWEESERRSAANGGVMRTSILGIWRFPDKDQVIQNAVDICRITHYDPRCVASCIAVSLAIRAFLIQRGNNISSIISDCIESTKPWDIGIESQLKGIPRQISGLNLDEYDSIGYTFKATQAGFWAIKYGNSFFHGLQSVILEGGDADTNAAVAGAMLGAKFGFANIPSYLVENLLHREELEHKIQSLVNTILEN